MKNLKKISKLLFTGAAAMSLVLVSCGVKEGTDTESSTELSTTSTASSGGGTTTASSGSASSTPSTTPSTTSSSKSSTTKKSSSTTTKSTIPDEPKTEDGITITEEIAYTEGAYVTFNVNDGDTASNYKVSYTEDNTTYKEIDQELIRISGTSARADIVGLSAGAYKIKVEKTGTTSTAVTKTLTVTADDRSGYAHFNNENGIGAYNNDGTLKDNAIVVYVNDTNKNTVKATINGNEVTGLVAILKAATNADESVDIRILGEIQTQQWNSLKHGTGRTTTRQANLDAAFASVDWETTTANELNNPGMTKSSNYYKIDEADIKAYGINSMSTDEAAGITHLDGLTNNVLRDIASSSDDLNGDGTTGNDYEFDSYYNELDIKFGNNITVEGIGADAKIFQWGFCFNQCNSVEVKNIEFSDYTEDAIGIQGASSDITKYSDYWIHNCTFNSGKNNWDVCWENDKNEGDGSTDFKSAHDLTISYCRYNGTHKTALIGSGSTSYQYNITMHHNYYNTCGSRLPFTRNSNIHMYNNYYYGSTGTNSQFYASAYGFAENCYFKNVKTPLAFGEGGTSAVKALGCIFDNTDSSKYSIVTSRTATVSNTCKADKTTDYSKFDTNSTLFYYDSVNQCSDVDILNDTVDIPTLIPSIAGAGLNIDIRKATNIESVKYTVTFDAKGGSSVSSIEVKENTSPTSLPTPTKDDYDFAGWYTDEAFTKQFTTSSKVTEDITVYAKWTESSYKTATYTTANPGEDEFPTESGIYYTDLNGTDGNLAKDNVAYGISVKYDATTIYVNDTEANDTAVAYYIMDSSKVKNTGTVTVSMNLVLTNIGSKWEPVRFINADGTEFLSISINASKLISYTYGTDGTRTEGTASTITAAANTTYAIKLIMDYDNNTITLTIDSYTVTIDSTVDNLSIIKFFTAKSATNRSFTVTNLTIE